MKCAYCGEEAFYTLKNGKYCCRDHHNSCPAVRDKCSRGLAKAHSEGRMRTDQFDGKRNWNKGKTAFSDRRIRVKVSRENVFSIGSNVRNYQLKKILICEGLRRYECERCGNGGDWKGSELVLELDHINGDHGDNRVDNLRFLCPNCHSQTETYRNRNQHGIPKKKPLSDDQMIHALRSFPSINAALCGLGRRGRGNYERAKRLIDLHGIVFEKPEKPKKVASIPKAAKQRKIVFCAICGRETHQRRKYCTPECTSKAVFAQQKLDWDSFDLEAIYKEQGSLLGMVRYFENKVSDNAIRKQMRKRGIMWLTKKQKSGI